MIWQMLCNRCLFGLQDSLPRNVIDIVSHCKNAIGCNQAGAEDSSKASYQQKQGGICRAKPFRGTGSKVEHRVLTDDMMHPYSRIQVCNRNNPAQRLNRCGNHSVSFSMFCCSPDILNTAASCVRAYPTRCSVSLRRTKMPTIPDTLILCIHVKGG